MPQTPRAERPSPNILSSSAAPELTFYPAYTFKASATWFSWVKLPARDIHLVLQPHKKYADIAISSVAPERWGYGGGGSRDDAPLLLFYLNHPIQFVQVVGVVVVLEDYFEKFWLFTVDDGSGATIDVTCRKPEKEAEAGKGKSTSQAANRPTEEQCLHETLSALQIGTVVQAKGTISTFRSTRQLTLLRLSIVPDTTHEMALMSARTSFIKSTLSKPWVLSLDDQRRLSREARDDREQGHRHAARKRERQAKLQERERRHARLIQEQYEAEEKQRAKAADATRRAGHALREHTVKH
ncbi:hypothetical protein A1O3_00777 [Capronia epimyces CBS 606.96]|uniref:CST complex subunit STN1 n=1 Tax=Capronia epimyces CBS 606.96 TaxID=1182542 RepID=W9YH50_9EURO|nr:uncharacterized protein A1O3_00777 [Capronia epimyces CBS 606.96]EXJ92227.1 hypothetical protein A1O3_00777 [Capronia epimyces CBS 606.96]